jgi:MOSC domain-containing protein
MQSVAVIRNLGRYPVKSMRGESLAATMLTLQGVPADRRYAFVQTASRSSSPWLTARELPELLCYSTCVEEARPQEVEVTVTAPGGEKFPIKSHELR